jgi:hypothetical protein
MAASSAPQPLTNFFLWRLALLTITTTYQEGWLAARILIAAFCASATVFVLRYCISFYQLNGIWSPSATAVSLAFLVMRRRWIPGFLWWSEDTRLISVLCIYNLAFVFVCAIGKHGMAGNGIRWDCIAGSRDRICTGYQHLSVQPEA